MEDLIARIQSQALTVRPLRALLTALAFPFYVLGLAAGVLVVVVLFAIAAVRTGVGDVRSRSGLSAPPGGDG